MQIKKLANYALASTVLAAATGSYAAESSDIEVIGNLGINSKDMELVIRDRTLEAQFTTLDLSLTLAKGRFYLSLNHDRSIQDDVQSNGTGLIFYSREDNSVTLGYSASKSITVFGGFRAGNTTSHYNVGNGKFNVKSNGPFLGANYTYVVGDAGSLGFNIAAAKLSGEVSLDEPFADRSRIPNAPATIDGDALGFSYGVGWSGILGDTTSYGVGVKLHRYSFDDQVEYGGINLSYDENFTTLYMRITNYF